MTPDEIKLIRYRIERARTSLEAAESLFGQGHLHDAVNRLYVETLAAVAEKSVRGEP